MRFSKHQIGYFLLILMCLLTATRDVSLQDMFARKENPLNSILVVFLGAFLAQVLALITLVSKGELGQLKRDLGPRSLKQHWGQFLIINLGSGISFLAYFWALELGLTAGQNSLISFGSDPLMTGLVAYFVTKERFTPKFLLVCFLGVVGILCIGATHWSSDFKLTPQILGGILLSIFSSLCFVFFVIGSKKLLEVGMGKSSLLFSRLIFSTVGLGIYLLFNPASYHYPVQELAFVSVASFFGMSLCLLIMLYVIANFNLKHFALLLFLIPVLTNVFAVLFGIQAFRWNEFIGGSLILLSVMYYEITSTHK